MKHRAPGIAFVFVTLLLDVLGFGLLIPVAPKLLAYVQGLPILDSKTEAAMAEMTPEDRAATERAIHDAESATAPQVGMLMATYAAMQFVCAPILGSLSDRFGRRPVILVSLAGSGIDYLIAATAPNLAILFITRAVNGISGANMTACSAYIADITPPEKRAASFGIIGAAFGLGFVLGPLAGGVIGSIDIRLPYVAAGVLTLINWLYGYLIMPESLPREHRRPFTWAKANPLGAFLWLRGHPVVITLGAALFLLNMGQFGLHATWVLSMGYRYNWGPEEVGWSLFLVGITSAVIQGLLSRKLIPILGERASLFGGILIGILAFAGYALATEGWMIYAIIVAASIGGIAGPAAQGIASKAVPPNEQGLLQGAFASLNSIAMIFGPLAAAGAFHYFTSRPAGESLPGGGGGSPFWLGTALYILSLIPLAMIWSRLPTTVRAAPVEQG
jgi:MFS transporter, DHA1 family, tetracycline resistance protein